MEVRETEPLCGSLRGPQSTPMQGGYISMGGEGGRGGQDEEGKEGGTKI